MWDLTVSVPDHCLSFYFPHSVRKIYHWLQEKLKMDFRKLQSTSGYHDKLSRQFPFSSYNITVADRENDEIVPQRLPMKTPDMTS